MNVAEIKFCDIADGLGVRTSLFVSGCTHRCEGCFNEVAWDFAYGEPFDDEVQERILESLAPSHIRGLTLLGGEPMEPVNQRALLPFIRRFRESLPDKDLWCYTGYTLETDLAPGRFSGQCPPDGTKDGAAPASGRARCEVTDELLSYIDVLVDGEFILEKKSLMLKFRGSSNQRLIDLKATLASGSIVLLAV
ncbi:MAG: radical SAM protein [Lachnospiraceae bacterium]|nr:radical SAM protein [Lachnospiraceae bacterium]